MGAELVAVEGHALGSGKGTFIRLLAGWLQPEAGRVFISPHLKVMHVPFEHCFFQKRNLLENLCLGMPDQNHSAALLRARALMQKFGFEEDSLEKLSTGAEHPGEWLNHFSLRARSTLSLIRALMSRPHVLLLQLPLYVHDFRRRALMLRIFREF